MQPSTKSTKYKHFIIIIIIVIIVKNKEPTDLL